MSFADDYVARFEPWLPNADLETYLRAIAKMFEEVELYAFETDEWPGWTILLDPDRSPFKALPYLAQYKGERLPTGISEAGAREWIKDSPNQRRGTPRAVFFAAQRRLTGSRLVSIKERDPNVDSLLVVTYVSETPDPAATRQDIESVVPADVQLTYETRTGQAWSDVTAAYASWNAVSAANSSWAQLASTLAGSSTFQR